MPALLIRSLPEILRILNAWLSGKSFDTLHSALEAVIADIARFAPQGQNTRLLLDAAQRMDVPVSAVAGRTMQLGWGSRSRWLDSSVTDHTSAIASRFARDKRITNRFLGAHGIPVPRQMDAADLEAAIAAAAHIGYPVVVKPANLDGGLGVTADIRDDGALATAYEVARQYSPQVIVESHIAGEDIRIGVVNGAMAWATAREPAGVTGDGASTVQQLIDQANRDPRRGVRHWSLMSPISINAEARELMKEQGIGLADVPTQGRFIRLRSAANISSGGTPHDIMAQVHPDNRDMVQRVCRLMRLNIAGVDFITPDITRSWREVGGGICEVNAQPQFTVVAPGFPFSLVGGLFEGDVRIPVIVLLDSAKSVSTEHLLNAFNKNGLRLGLVSQSKAWVNGGPLHIGQGGSFETTQSLLVDPDVDCVIALLDDESWLTTGAPVDRFDLLFADEHANSRQFGFLKALQSAGVRSLSDARLDSLAGAEALADQAAALLAWHDGQSLPVERIASAAISASPLARKGPAAPGSIGLCMIAKNEAGIIRQSLDSVLGLVDFVLVEDTGSTDGTQEVVRQWLHDNGVAGEVIEEGWRDFGWNRTHALARLRGHHEIDYALILDADDVLVRATDFDAEAFKAGLTADTYDLDIHFGALRFPRPQLLRNAKPFGYRGVLHEFVEVPPECTERGAATGLHVQAYSRGARSQNRNKYQDDIALLEQAAAREQDPGLRSRYLFYLAQSLQDAREYDRALTAYCDRAAIQHWPDEMYVAAYRAARLKERLGHSATDIAAAYRDAIAICPARLEAYHGLSRFLRLKRRYAEALEIGQQGLKSSKADEVGLFIDSRIYNFGLLEEVAISAGFAGHHRECVGYCEALLARSGVPEMVEERIRTLLQRASKGRVDEIMAPPRQRLETTAPLMRIAAGAGG